MKANLGFRRVALALAGLAVAGGLLAGAGMRAGATSGGCADPMAGSATVSATLGLDRVESEALARFYAGRGGTCAWNAASAAGLIAAIGRADLQGLDPARYRADDIQRLAAGGDAGAADAAETAMALRFAHDMMAGRVDLAEIYGDVDIPVPPADAVGALNAALAKGGVADWPAALAPADPVYDALVNALAAYRAIEARGGWSAIPGGKALKPGQSDPAVAALKARLGIEPVADAPDTLFDAATMRALQDFQRGHGLTADGKLGAATRTALNLPVAQRIDQILANLERRRILDRALPAWGVTVNVAAATATLVEDGQTVLAMRAIVGDRRHHTPMLVSAADAVIVNPSWVVPRSIVRHEIEPALRRDPAYLDKNRMAWKDGQLVQAPGPKNSLGLIKFEFANPFSVYMHDTPAKTLFALDDRARSHGCMRLERPVDLAVELLKADPAWTRETIQAAMDAGATRTIRLPRKVPVAVVYWTVFPDADGHIAFREDLYGRDARLMDALRAPKPAGATLALADIGCRAG